MPKTIRSLTIISVAALIPTLAFAEGNANKGKALYAQQCASCHGAGAKGDGPAAAALTPKLKNLADKAYQAGLKDQYLTDVITKGGAGVGKSPVMPAFGAALKDEGVRDVVAFLRSLAK